MLVLGVGIFSVAFSQSKISGKVVNGKNEALAGASVKLIGASGGTTTDVEGRYSLTLSATKKYEIEFSAIGYQSKTVSEIDVVDKQNTELNITLEVATKSLEGVVVKGQTTTARRESVASIIAFQKNTNTVASVISAESIRRSPDRNTGEVLKRTPGASIQEGRFIIIRGLSDRYNQAMLNGILLTSTEPDRKTFSFDIIPAPMIDNIVINKAFVPELPGEWAGGLIQVNTKDIPTKNFFNIQVGTGFNSQTVGKDFLKDKGGKTDFLGYDDGARGLPKKYTTKSEFDLLSNAEKTALGKSLPNSWKPETINAPLNVSFQANGGFASTLFGKKIGGTVGLIYAKNNRYLKLLNASNVLGTTGFTQNYSYNDDRYQQDVSVGALGSLSMQLNPLNKVSLKAIINVNTPNSVIQREGQEFGRAQDVRGTELSFRQNTFFTVQATGEHSVAAPLKLKWFGSFNILDGYIPDQRRVLYGRNSGTSDPYSMIISNTLSQQNGSRIFQSLSDYIYTGGGDLSYNFNAFGQKQTLKGGYMFQIKDRLYDAKLFANYLPTDNPALRLLPAELAFAPENFGDGSASSNLLAFDAIKGNSFRYLANTILNAGFLQLDNQLTPSLRVVWGLRVENYDQLVGSVKAYDDRFTRSKVTDFLPGLNATLKLNQKTNLRLSGSQTVIRPELRELTKLNLYDFELNASVTGSPTLQRTKVTNFDIRYELYPRAGETFSLGVFYKQFRNAIEQIFDESSGGASTFTFRNADKAKSYGVELEVRKKLDFADALRNFTLQGNASYIYSRVTDKTLKIDRPLQGQSPYVLNFGLMYDIEKAGVTATVLYNQIGRRLYVVQNATVGGGSPDVYEAPRPLLDFQLTKKILKNRAELKMNISDIINQTQYFYQNSDDKTTFVKDKDAFRFTRKFGTTFGFTFNYSL